MTGWSGADLDRVLAGKHGAERDAAALVAVASALAGSPPPRFDHQAWAARRARELGLHVVVLEERDRMLILRAGTDGPPSQYLQMRLDLVAFGHWPAAEVEQVFERELGGLLRLLERQGL